MLLALVALSVGAASRLLAAPTSSFLAPERLAGYVDAELTPLLDRPEALATKLERVREAFDVEIAVYRHDGSPIARAGDAPPLDAPPERPLTRRQGGAYVAAAPIAGGRAYVVARHVWRGGGAHWLLMPLIVLGVIALVSLPITRAIVRPLERVTRAARALGAGDLSARTHIRRSDEIGDLAQAFDDMAARLERLVETEKELLANISHELRTPLARIRVALELAEGDDPDGARRRLRGIGDDLTELEALVEQVLLTARLDHSGTLPLARESVEVAAIVKRACERFEVVHVDHRLEPTVEEVTIHADGKLLRRVVDNLLDNAAKYADPESGPIEIEVEAAGGGVRFEVRDRGMGVSESDLPQLFAPFFRTDRSRARGTGGTGLGLALCRRVVEAHGGTIEAASREGGGLVVRFWLPDGVMEPEVS
jgi:two-component system, OmpR family, sensor kinase